MADLTAYWVAESTIIAASNPAVASQLYEDMVGEEWAHKGGLHPPVPLTDAQLDERHQDFDEDEAPIPGQTFSFRELLAARNGVPCVLADWE